MTKGEKLDKHMLETWKLYTQKNGQIGSYYDWVRDFLNTISDKDFDFITKGFTDKFGDPLEE